MGMTIDTVTKWLGIIRANLKVFPEVGSDKKIESLDTAISYLKDLEMYQLDYNARLKADMVVVLDKLRAEIETKYGQCDICEYFEDYDYEENDISEYRPIGNITDILQIIDNYRVESEDKE